MIRKILLSLTVLALSLVAYQQPAEACGGRILSRIAHPFNGNGIPVVRRLRGRGIGQANYQGGYGSGGSCASCSN